MISTWQTVRLSFTPTHVLPRLSTPKTGLIFPLLTLRYVYFYFKWAGQVENFVQIKLQRKKLQKLGWINTERDIWKTISGL